MLLLAAVTALLAVVPTAAGSSNDPRADRDRVRSDKAATASQVNALQASDTEVDQALQALDENVRGQQAAYSDAQRGGE